MTEERLEKHPSPRAAVGLILALLTLALLTLARGAAALTTGGGPAAAQAPGVPGEEPPGPADGAEVAAFLDAFFPPRMAELRIPGAAVVVVRDGEILAARGYGFADLERGEPVVAGRTLFPAASVSKLFTATAALQLVEEGRLDLDADVNRYLTRFQIPATFPQPVTLRHLLTHTAGFEDSEIGLLAAGEEEVLPLGDFLARHLAPRLRPPGRLLCYTNFAMMLAGHLVEEASGEPFDHYVTEHLLRPLAMERSAPLPLAGALRDDLAMGYTPAGGGFRPTRELLDGRPVRPAARSFPAGFLAAPVTDMAHFLIAHLEDGAYRGGRILAPATVRQMHATQFVQHPDLPGMAFGFFEMPSHGLRALGHGGDGLGYGSLLYLLPDERTGFYLAHSNASPRLRLAFLAAFLDRTFPASRGEGAGPGGEAAEGPAAKMEPAGEPTGAATGPAVTSRAARAPGDARRLAGSYAQLRRVRTTLEKLPTTLPQLRLVAPDPATLVLDRPLPRRYRMTGPLSAHRAGGEGRLVFLAGGDGHPAYLYLWDGDLPQLMAFERVSWLDGTRVQLTLLGLFAVLFLSLLLGWPAAALLSRLRRRHRETPPLLRRVRATAAGAAAGNLAFLAGMAWIVLRGGLVLGISPAVRLLLILPLVTALLAALLLVLTVQLWRRRLGPPAGRVHVTLVALAAALFPLYLWHWNLLGYHLG